MTGVYAAGVTRAGAVDAAAAGVSTAGGPDSAGGGPAPGATFGLAVTFAGLGALSTTMAGPVIELRLALD